MSDSCHYESHITAAVIENVKFLLEAGEPIDHIAHRLGYSLAALQKKMERAG